MLGPVKGSIRERERGRERIDDLFPNIRTGIKKRHIRKRLERHTRKNS